MDDDDEPGFRDHNPGSRAEFPGDLHNSRLELLTELRVYAYGRLTRAIFVAIRPDRVGTACRLR